MPGNETMRGDSENLRLAQGMHLDNDLFQGGGGHFIYTETLHTNDLYSKSAFVCECICS